MSKGAHTAERLASRLLVEHARAITVDGLIESQPEMWRALLNSLMPTHDATDCDERYERLKAALPLELQHDLRELADWYNDNASARLQAGYWASRPAGFCGNAEVMAREFADIAKLPLFTCASTQQRY